jgi:hypothetical protein
MTSDCSEMFSYIQNYRNFYRVNKEERKEKRKSNENKTKRGRETDGINHVTQAGGQTDRLCAKKY